jgi:RNA polymerase sigma factor (sigma-70 family)
MWNDSWRAIYDRFGEAILAYARRGGLNEHSAQDVLQEVMTTLIRCQHGQAAGYNPAGGSFQGWLWTVIRNRVHSVRRKDRKEEADVPEAAPDFARREESEWQRALLAAAMQKVRERVNPKNFAIYTALLEENAGPEKLAASHGMKANAIYALKHRCEEMLLCEARALRESWDQLRTQSSAHEQH